MSEKISEGVLLYRYQNEDLEVFLVPSESSATKWSLPNQITDGKSSNDWNKEIEEEDQAIELDPVNCEDRKMTLMAKAFELVEKLPENSKRRKFLSANKGAFIAMKEAFKKVAPAEYQMLKELQEVLNVRDLMRYL